MIKDVNNKIVEIGDIVKVSNSPIKSYNATYVVAQDGTSDLYMDKNSLTLYKVAKHKGGYSLSKSSNNIAFYPLCNFSNRYSYTKEEMAAATIEILIKNDPSKVSLEMSKDANDYNCYDEIEEKYLYFYCTIETIDGNKIEDTSYSLKQQDKMSAFLSNITLKQNEKINIVKRCDIRGYQYFRDVEFEAVYTTKEVQIQKQDNTEEQKVVKSI